METRNASPPPLSSYTTHLSQLFKKDRDLNQDIDPKKAAYQVGARGYRLINGPSDVLVMLGVGCFGVPPEDEPSCEKKKDVSKLMNTIAAKKLRELKQIVRLILGCGDNFYHNGVLSWIDDRFREFHATYGDPDLEYIKDIPWWLCLGNHDSNYHKWEQFVSSVSSYVSTYTSNLIRPPIALTGEDVAINQVAYTYTTQPNDPCPVPKREFFADEKSNITNIDIDHLAKWNMPFLFNFFIWENVAIFVLNSSAYPIAWLRKKEEEKQKQTTEACAAYDKQNIQGIDEADLLNQAIFFETAFRKAKASGMTTVVLTHHPLFTVTPRAFNYRGDAKLYFKNPKDLEEILKLLQLPENCVVFNEILRRLFEEENIGPDIWLTAHDHCNYYYNNLLDPNASYKICQVTTGGGGGHLQDMVNFNDHNNIGGFLKYHGCVSLTFNKNEPGLIIIEIFTTEGHHLKFTNKSPHPVRVESTDNKVETLRDCMIYACHQYQDFLNAKQTYHEGSFFWPADHLYKHKLSDTHIMHDILNYVNREIPSDFETTASTLFELVNKISNKTSKHSLFLYIKNKLEEEKIVLGKEVIQRFAALSPLNNQLDNEEREEKIPSLTSQSINRI